MVSAMTGEWLDGPELDAGYWYDSLRSPVEFDRAVRGAGRGRAPGVRRGVPAPGADRGDHRDPEGAGHRAGGDRDAAPRRRRPGPARWPSLAAGPRPGRAGGLGRGARRPGGGSTCPPTRSSTQRYWPAPARPRRATLAAAGLGAAGHPLLGAAVELAGGDGLVLTGRLSRAAQPWLADHAVGGTVLLPGTAFVELAVRAGDAAGCGRVEELTLEAPLVLPADGGGAGPGGGGRPGRGRAAGRWRCTPGPSRRAGRAVDPARQRAAGPGRRAGRGRHGARGRGRRAGAVPVDVDGPVRGAGRRPGTATARRSAGCGRRGGAATRCSPRSRCRRTRRGAGGVRGAPGAAGRGAARLRPGCRAGDGPGPGGPAAVRVERGVAARGRARRRCGSGCAATGGAACR